MLKAAKNRSLHSTRILASVFGGLCCFKQSSIPVYRTGPWVSSGFIAAFKTQELISHFSRIFLLSLVLVILYFIFPFLFVSQCTFCSLQIFLTHSTAPAILVSFNLSWLPPYHFPLLIFCSSPSLQLKMVYFDLYSILRKGH